MQNSTILKQPSYLTFQEVPLTLTCSYIDAPILNFSTNSRLYRVISAVAVSEDLNDIF